MIELILAAGKAGVELALFVLLPVMIVMLVIMRLLEARNILSLLVHYLSPVLRPLGIPGLGIFALLQIMLVSFAAPVATLSMMNKNGTSQRHIAATLALVLSAAQANVVFPMSAMGLDAGFTFIVALLAALFAAAVTYHIFARHLPEEVEPQTVETDEPPHNEIKDVSSTLTVINSAGREAFELAINAIPMLVLALLLVNILQEVGAMELLGLLLSPLLWLLGYPDIAVLPIVSKYIAGGTAMMGVSAEYLQQDLLTTDTFNRMAGFLIQPFDIVGIALLATAGTRVAAVMRPAIYGALVGIMARVLIHGLWY
ncbi:nucleoside recognition domain-containing protein [Candidatus Albibeggiatoa sp. nov. NOAA]|uniref:nucleoside recognition domain-containing protein n=1 Tax=Candidatus Albibeggiatoa sp. nov. NOAA TaxID=3162724 RepID=UPI003301B880|nr:nucleoside recognition family protein [Thiotrichaceae bacterium]